MLPEELLKIKSLKKYYADRSPFGKLRGYLKAVDDVSFVINKDQVFALVGESGSGKSTIANLILRLIEPTSGEIYFKGKNIFTFKKNQLMEYRKAVQIIFQDPFASLNPRMRIIDILSEPFKIHKIVEKERIESKISQMLNMVGMSTDILNKYPHEFSGGQRQRICIARALTLSPELLVADEPLSALDVSIQAQILNLFQKIRQEVQISFLFISHDLKIVKYFSDVVAVMCRGKIVEMAKSEDIFCSPLHPYTKLLISSAPELRIVREKERKHDYIERKNIAPDFLNQIDLSLGCVFRTRCLYKVDICQQVEPPLREVSGRILACHNDLFT
ncbi:MAG: ATP-binding cassette domain-containing protein [Thermodesulfovibrionales bacterium]|nr:ATP-binding cassette domain-containing protein [Thermodesulfovibrionales bacterium]